MKPTINVRDAVRPITLTVNVRGVRTMQIRLWLGLKLIQLATRVIGCQCEIEGREP